MAYQFAAASSQYLTADLALDFNPMTIASWVYCTSLSSQFAIANVGRTSDSHRNQLIVLTTGALRINQSAVVAGQADSTSGFSVNTWGHACGVFTSLSSRTVYLNAGSSATNTTNTGATGQTNVIGVGARYLASWGQFANAISAETGIWNVALTADEIASLAKGVTCNLIRPQSLVFYAPLIRDLQDVRGGLTITNNNGATVANHPRVYR